MVEVEAEVVEEDIILEIKLEPLEGSWKPCMKKFLGEKCIEKEMKLKMKVKRKWKRKNRIKWILEKLDY